MGFLCALAPWTICVSKYGGKKITVIARSIARCEATRQSYGSLILDLGHWILDRHFWVLPSLSVALLVEGDFGSLNLGPSCPERACPEPVERWDLELHA